MDIVSMLVTQQVLALAAGITALVWGIGSIPTKNKNRLRDSKVWRRILPLVPLVLGVGGAFLPGVVTGEDGSAVPWGEAVVVGLWTGFLAAHGRKVIKRLAIDKLDDRKV